MFKKFVRVENVCIGNIIQSRLKNYYEITKKELKSEYSTYYYLHYKLIYSRYIACPSEKITEHHRNTELLVLADNMDQIKFIDV